MAVAEFIVGPLVDNPYRVGHTLFTMNTLASTLRGAGGSGASVT